jgi:hypothetical protein
LDANDGIENMLHFERNLGIIAHCFFPIPLDCLIRGVVEPSLASDTLLEKMQINMQYPLTEKIGEPELFVGREKEFRQINKWLDNIPKRLSKSRVIGARRKSGINSPTLCNVFSTNCGLKMAW